VARDWRDERIEELEKLVEQQRQENAAQRKEIASQRKEIAALRERLAKLEERLGKTSRNSSKPPSSDGPSAPPRRKRKRGRRKRKQGAQPGHDKHERQLVPVEEVDELVVLKPELCGCCGEALEGDDPAPHRHQVFELPEVRPKVAEWQLHSLWCDRCEAVTTAQLPDGVPTRAFGPSVDAAVALLSGAYRLSKRLVAAVMEDLLGLRMSVGSVVACERSASEALAPPVEEASEFTAEQPFKHADETGWREENKRFWLWAVVTQFVTVFMVHARRNTDAARELLGKASGILHTDRHGAYNWWPTKQRQVCWSHLERDINAIAERGGDSERLGNALLDEVHRMFHWWHRVRDGTLARSTFQSYMRPLMKRVEDLFAVGAELPHPRTSRTCSKILKLKDALWTFVRIEGVEPTNNAAEHAVRHGVIWRKTSFGTQSAAGSRFVERVLTVHATLRQQKRNVLAFIRDACEARLHGHAPPTLLPTNRR